MKRIFVIAVVSAGMVFSSATWSYDATMAAHFSKLFSQVKGADAGKALQFISPESLIKDIRAKKDLVTIDIRTPGETGVFGLTLPGSLAIPVDQMFEPRNLDRIPVDKPVVIICKSGARATAVGTSLRHIGFDNVYILNGGFQALSSYYGISQAYDKK